MTQEQAAVKEWMKKFGQECPDKPTIPSREIRRLRAKLILEETMEVLKGLGFYLAPTEAGTTGGWAGQVEIKEFCSPTLVEIADGCEDLKVVTEGTLVACGLLKKSKQPAFASDYETLVDPLFSEVMRSNNTKMWTVDEWTAEVDKQINNPDWTSKTILDPNNPEEILGIIVKDRNGKVIKPPGYSPTNLQPIIDEMSK